MNTTLSADQLSIITGKQWREIQPGLGFDWAGGTWTVASKDGNQAHIERTAAIMKQADYDVTAPAPHDHPLDVYDNPHENIDGGPRINPVLGPPTKVTLTPGKAKGGGMEERKYVFPEQLQTPYVPALLNHPINDPHDPGAHMASADAIIMAGLHDLVSKADMLVKVARKRLDTGEHMRLAKDVSTVMERLNNQAGMIIRAIGDMTVGGYQKS